jgi:hypothetical protein
MNMATSDFAWFTLNVRPWIATIASVITSGVATGLYVAWRKGRSDDRKTDVEAEKVASDTADGIRDHYAEELKSLRGQIIEQGRLNSERQNASDERYRKSMEAADAREAACQENVDKLRREVATLTEEVLGLRRILAQSARSALVLAGSTPPSPSIIAAADRAAEAIEQASHRVQAERIDHETS